MIIHHTHEQEKVLIASCCQRHDRQLDHSLIELARLVQTAGGDVAATIIQERDRFDPALLFGKGKVQEIKELVTQHCFDMVAVDQELTPTQNRNLEEAWKIKVIDRTGLILDIFAKHARSREGKLQVELAQLNYLLPRLTGQWLHLGRQEGGIGMRGPGETQLEVDRRRAREKIARIRRELEGLETHREQQRTKREAVPLPLVTLVGYTNAGKSTLMNRLTDAGVLVEDALFATLDPTVRKLSLPSGRDCLLADTVGFINRLPHDLIEAFKSTFKEVGRSSLLLHVLDASSEMIQEQCETVDSVLAELSLDNKPLIHVLNKSDLLAGSHPMIDEQDLTVRLSALSGEGIASLLTAIEQQLALTEEIVTLLVPYDAGEALDEIYRSCQVLERTETAAGVQLRAAMGSKFRGKFASYQQIG